MQTIREIPASSNKRKRLVVKNLKPQQKNALLSGSGSLGGILAGAGIFTLFGFSSAENPESPLTPETGSESVVVYTEAPVAGSITDNMSFREAFEAARAEVGPGGFFQWHGDVFSTYTQQEWEAMNPEQQQEYADSLENSSEFIAPENDTPLNEPETALEEPVMNDAPTEQQIASAEPQAEMPQQDADAPTPEVEVQQAQDEPVTVELDLDGDSNTDALAVDFDHDNIVDAVLFDNNQDTVPDTYIVDTDEDNDLDTVVTDVNQDGIDESDVFEPLPEDQETTISMDELQGEPAASDDAPPAADEDLPDIDDNADVSDFI